MLRAMGMGDGLLRGVAAAEALLLWLIGTLGGLLLAVAMGLGIGYFSLSAEEARLILGGWWVGLVFGFLLLSLGVCIWAALRATAELRDQSPVTSLGLSG